MGLIKITLLVYSLKEENHNKKFINDKQSLFYYVEWKSTVAPT